MDRHPLRGEVTPPGDKSISHRALILGALGNGVSSITGLNPGADVGATCAVLGALGVHIEGDPVSGVNVTGTGGRFTTPTGPLDCGNSGTTMRLMAGVLAACPFRSELIGDASLTVRPMERVAAPLRGMGAEVETDDGHAPVRITGRAPLAGIEFESPVASGQLKSAILLAGLSASGRVGGARAGAVAGSHRAHARHHGRPRDHHRRDHDHPRARR